MVTDGKSSEDWTIVRPVLPRVKQTIRVTVWVNSLAGILRPFSPPARSHRENGSAGHCAWMRATDLARRTPNPASASEMSAALPKRAKELDKLG
jgi:hypothetical protein